MPQPSAIQSLDDVQNCANDLDKALLALTPQTALAFTTKWGEAVRRYLLDRLEGTPLDDLDWMG